MSKFSRASGPFVGGGAGVGVAGLIGTEINREIFQLKVKLKLKRDMKKYKQSKPSQDLLDFLLGESGGIGARAGRRGWRW
jgi:hypothetical protein